MNLRCWMRKRAWRVAGFAAAIVGCAVATEAQAGMPIKPFQPDQFESLLKQVEPQDGEVLFWEIPWFLNADEARAQAAKEDKPIVVWSGYGGAPMGVC